MSSVVLVGSETSTLHSDGDELAVTTDSGNNATKYVEKLAVDGGNQLVMLDREFAGESVEMHSKMGDTGVDVIPSYTISTGRYCSQNLTGTWPASGNLPGVGATIVPRKDGYLVGGLAIQGARAYDGELGQWITPDPYKGDVDSPMSQWGYQWNANNPITNSDASGLDSTSCNTGSAHTDQSSCSNDPWSCGGGYCENQAGDVEPECASASDIGCVTPPTVGQTSASTSTASTNPLTNGGAFDPLSLGFMLSLFSWFIPEDGGEILAAGRFLEYDDKIAGQMTRRGWTPELIRKTVEDAWQTFPAVDKHTRPFSPATGYVNEITGQFVVINNETGRIVQVGAPGYKMPIMP